MSTPTGPSTISNSTMAGVCVGLALGMLVGIRHGKCIKNAKKRKAEKSVKDCELRQQIIDVCRAMEKSGINQGTSGNVSARVSTGMYITPSGVR